LSQLISNYQSDESLSGDEATNKSTETANNSQNTEYVPVYESLFVLVGKTPNYKAQFTGQQQEFSFMFVSFIVAH